MTKKTYTATFGDQTFSRKTDRAYAFAVSCKPNYEQDLAEFGTQWKVDGLNHDYFVKCVANNDFPYSSPEEIERYKYIAANLTKAQYHEECIAKRVAVIEERKANGYYNKFFAPTFSSRRDLAEKEAASCRNRGRLEVTIVEAVLK